MLNFQKYIDPILLSACTNNLKINIKHTIVFFRVYDNSICHLKPNVKDAYFNYKVKIHIIVMVHSMQF